MAIATSNSELIINSVIILFITDTDEQVFDVLMVLNPRWVASMSRKMYYDDKRKDGEGNDGRFQELTNKNSSLQGEVNELRDQNSELQGEVSELRVIILFITDTDEQVFDVLMVLNPRWVASMSRKIYDDKRDDGKGNDGRFQELRNKNSRLQGEVDELRDQNSELQGEVSELRNAITSIRQEMLHINKRMGSEDSLTWENEDNSFDGNEEKTPIS
eukprot:CAMPEP_0184475622 /NCGR_PEP_ID=MMETSP0740-20130409/146657_1 /TAXON_ID=385413 /ORGANISM="Thalassiosira miniscula, Strain CCMP1093" /LENGTH=215 /DNA_ID=CAMNT_0026853139 /DNA_START=37 /DNA_END=683 /DNA_ORIENTATION=+